MDNIKQDICLDSIPQIFLVFFLQVADEVEGGILYVDSGAGEALHFMGGLPFILQLGVRAVCSLENASPLDAVRTLSLSLSPPLFLCELLV